jgi:hypothetical protein
LKFIANCRRLFLTRPILSIESSDETMTASRYGLDAPMSMVTLMALAQSFSQSTDGLRQVALFDVGIWPNLSH